MHFGDKWSATFNGDGYTGAGRRFMAITEEQAARIGEPDDAIVNKFKAADFIGGPETIFNGAH